MRVICAAISTLMRPAERALATTGYVGAVGSGAVTPVAAASCSRRACSSASAMARPARITRSASRRDPPVSAAIILVGSENPCFRARPVEPISGADRRAISAHAAASKRSASRFTSDTPAWTSRSARSDSSVAASPATSARASSKAARARTRASPSPAGASADWTEDCPLKVMTPVKQAPLTRQRPWHIPVEGTKHRAPWGRHSPPSGHYAGEPSPRRYSRMSRMPAMAASSPCSSAAERRSRGSRPQLSRSPE